MKRSALSDSGRSEALRIATCVEIGAFAFFYTVCSMI